MIVIESRGGLYSEGPGKALDFQEPYLRARDPMHAKLPSRVRQRRLLRSRARRRLRDSPVRGLSMACRCAGSCRAPKSLHTLKQQVVSERDVVKFIQTAERVGHQSSIDVPIV